MYKYLKYSVCQAVLVNKCLELPNSMNSLTCLDIEINGLVGKVDVKRACSEKKL